MADQWTWLLKKEKKQDASEQDAVDPQRLMFDSPEDLMAVVNSFGSAPDSKTKQTGEGSNRRRTSYNLTQDIYRDPGELVKYMTALQAVPQFTSQRYGSLNLQDMMTKQVEHPVQKDLSPTLAYLDTISGGNYSKQYQRPIGSRELVDKLMNYQGAINKVNNEYSDNVSNLLNASKMGQMQQQNLSEKLLEYMRGTQNLQAKRDDDYKRERDFERDVQKLETRYGSFITDAVSALRQIDGEIGGIDDAAEDKRDLPGYGQTGLAPTVLTSDKGKNLRKVVANLYDLIGRQRSGANITREEAERLLATIGASKLSSDADLLQGLKNFREVFTNILRGHEAGFKPEVVKTYAERMFGPGIGSYSGVVEKIGRSSAPKTTETGFSDKKMSFEEFKAMKYGKDGAKK